jgi:hypothetical protein
MRERLTTAANSNHGKQNTACTRAGGVASGEHGLLHRLAYLRLLLELPRHLRDRRSHHVVATPKELLELRDLLLVGQLTPDGMLDLLHGDRAVMVLVDQLEELVG